MMYKLSAKGKLYNEMEAFHTTPIKRKVVECKWVSESQSNYHGKWVEGQAVLSPTLFKTERAVGSLVSEMMQDYILKNPNIACIKNKIETENWTNRECGVNNIKSEG